MHMVTISDSLIYSVAKKDIAKELRETKNQYRIKVDPTEDLTIDRDYEDLQEIIHDFIQIFQANFSEEQTRQMLYRLKRLEIVRDDCVLKKNQIYVSLGGYNAYHNRMVIHAYQDDRLKDLIRDTVIHELIHMASARTTTVGYLTGFEIGCEVGKALNEGYTEYLREKYFTGEKGKYIESKDWRIPVVKAIEYMVGEKEMEEFFFNADLAGLLHALEPYATKEELIKLIFILDRTESTLGFSPKKYRIILRELAKMNERKLKMDLANHKIEEADYDFLKALKVEEVKQGRIWSEDLKFVQDENCFMITERGYKSPLYEIKSSTKEKNERMNSKIHRIIIK